MTMICSEPAPLRWAAVVLAAAYLGDESSPQRILARFSPEVAPAAEAFLRELELLPENRAADRCRSLLQRSGLGVLAAAAHGSGRRGAKDDHA